MFCDINATINKLTERFHLDEKILMLSSSVACLSFTILNTFENKGSIKIVFFFYNTVIDINQVDVNFSIIYLVARSDLGRLLHAKISY